MQSEEVNGLSSRVNVSCDKPRIAVLLAAFNGMKYIEEQIESILHQRQVIVTLYISVDYSTDGTFEWCKDLESRCLDVSVLQYGERYGGAAKNFYRLIRDVPFHEFDFVALSDQDDVWLAEKLSHAITVISDNNLDAVSSDVVTFWENGRRMLARKSYPQKKYDYLFEAAGPGCSYVFTAKSLMEFKVFLCSNWIAINNVALHDWLIYAYYRSSGMRWNIDSKPLLLYRQHQSNYLGANYGIASIIKRVKLIKSKWYRREVEKIVALVAGNSFILSKSFLLRNYSQLRRRRRDVHFLLLMILFNLF